MKQYKPSMFNYVLKQDDSMILYNSMQGISSICAVSKDKTEKISEWLYNKVLQDIEDDDFKILVDNGYLIPESVNEHNKRSILYAKYVCEPVLSLVIHTTKECNFRCQYCYMNFEPIFLSLNTCESIIKFIQKNLHKYNSVKISWFGGEPLLGLDSIEYISKRVMKICKLAKKPYYSSITTNGYLLTPKNIQTLIACNVTTYTITIDGVRSTHDSLRFLKNKKPTFDRIIDNLIYIKDNIKCSKLRIVIRNNLTKTTAKSIDEYYSFYNKTFGRDRRFSLFVRPVRDAGGESVKEISSDLLTNDEMDNILRHLSNIVDRDGISFLSNFSELEPAGYTCPATCVGKYSIDVFGKVSKCDSVEPGLEIGYLDETGNLVRCGTNEEDWIAGCFQYDEHCEDCFFSATCFKGTCPIGKTIECRFTCKMRKNEINSLLNLFLASCNPQKI